VPEAEFERMLRVAAPALELVLLLCHEAGLRSKAALEMTRENVDLDNQRITGKTKGGVNYDIPMTKRLHDRLLWYCAAAARSDEPLTAIFRPHRALLTQGGMRSAMAQARIAADLTTCWTLHDLRRTRARAIYAATGDIRKVQAFLGHRMLWTTCWYLGNGLQSLTHDDMERSTGCSPKHEQPQDADAQQQKRSA
jgi:integrase